MRYGGKSYQSAIRLLLDSICTRTKVGPSHVWNQVLNLFGVFFSSLKREMMPSGRKKAIAAHIDRASEDVTFVSDLCLSFIASVIELTIHSVAASAKASMNVCIH